MKRTSFTTGLITGAVIGAALGVMMDPMKEKHTNTLRSTASGFFKTIGGVLDNVISNDK